MVCFQCNVVEGSYLFKRCDKAFVKAIVFRLRAQEYLPGDFIAKATEASLEMYFIRYGRVKIMGEGDVIYGLLDEGDLFGELEIFSGKRRKATVQVLTHNLQSIHAVMRMLVFMIYLGFIKAMLLLVQLDSLYMVLTSVSIPRHSMCVTIP